MNKKEFIKYLKEINIEITDEIYKKLYIYYEMLVEWNNKFNMTTILEEKDVFLLHFYDSLCLSKATNLNNEITLCDFGTGAGFPGLVIAIVFDKIKVTLIESNQKKCLFLNAVIDKLHLNNVLVVNERIENYGSIVREKFDVVTCRAVTSIPMILELSSSLIKLNGILAPLKSNCDDEIKKYSYLESKLGIKFYKKISYNLPINNASRIIPIYVKNKVTDLKYPRNYSTLLKMYKNKCNGLVKDRKK